MAQNLWVQAGRLLAAAGADVLTARKSAILAFVEAKSPGLVDIGVAAIKRSEPGGWQMAIFAADLNRMLDSLGEQAKAAIPPAVSRAVDAGINWLTATAKGA